MHAWYPLEVSALFTMGCTPDLAMPHPAVVFDDKKYKAAHPAACTKKVCLLSL